MFFLSDQDWLGTTERRRGEGSVVEAQCDSSGTGRVRVVVIGAGVGTSTKKRLGQPR